MILDKLQQFRQKQVLKQFPIAYKLAIIITMLISSGMILLGLVIVSNQTQLLRGQMTDFGQTVAGQLANSSKELILSDDVLSIMVSVKNLGAHKGILGAVVYSEKGKKLASAGVTPETDIISLYAQSKNNQSKGYSFEWQSSIPNSEEQLNVISFITPIRFQNLIAGHALVTFSKASLSQSLNETVNAIIAATIFMIILGIFTAYALGQRLSRPIHNLLDASKAIDNGDYSYRINEQRNDEIGSLIDGFNSMAKGLLEKSQVENAFSRFVSTNVAKQIMDNLDSIQLGGQHVHATALFADIVGFTSMSEKLPPREVATLLNEYFTYISMACELYNGTIDKYMGDCAMVVFGVPQADADHQFNAISCAIMIQRLIQRLNVLREQQGKQAVHFRIGINSGEMLAGNMGSNDRMQYTVVGEAVNLAARLHTAAESGQIVITDTLVKSADIQWRIIAHRHKSIELRGITEPVTTYIVTDLKSPYTEQIDQHITTVLAKKFVA
ncbi:Adenylate cyclase [hydrothermal vent metagenome]|uniref:Adenylate cyclase n=1 Tax=hydrothermal vent metagenome TaxID=652676 RepID=A0A3B1AL77_9ZZZZ